MCRSEQKGEEKAAVSPVVVKILPLLAQLSFIQTIH